MNFGWLNSCRDGGLLLLRVGLGVMMVMHGWPKLAGGVDRWEQLGAAMAHFGITFAPAFWGLMAAVAETAGGVFLAVGFLFRPAAAGLFCTMVVATTMRYKTGGGEFLEWAWPAEMAIVFLALFFIGPGKFSFER